MKQDVYWPHDEEQEKEAAKNPTIGPQLLTVLMSCWHLHAEKTVADITLDVAIQPLQTQLAAQGAYLSDGARDMQGRST